MKEIRINPDTMAQANWLCLGIDASYLSAPLPCQVVHPTFTRLPCHPQGAFCFV